MGLGHIGMEQGAAGVPGSTLYLKAVIALHLSDKFSPLSCQIVWQLKGRAKRSLFLSSCWCQIWDLPTLGWQWEKRHSLRSGQAEGEAKTDLLYFSLSYLVDLSLITISAETETRSETLYENLNLSRYLCWEKAAVLPPQVQIDLGTRQFQICSAGEVMRRFFCIQIVCTPYAVGEEKASCAGFKVQPFHVLPSLLPSFPQTGSPFHSSALNWAL